MREITDRIYIGDVETLEQIETVLTMNNTPEIDFILNLSTWYSHKIAKNMSYVQNPIPDGKGNIEDFQTAVETVWRRLARTDDKILVNCAAGVSRSVAVTATVHALRQDLEYSEALEQVRAGQRPHPSMDSYAEETLDKLRPWKTGMTQHG